MATIATCGIRTRCRVGCRPAANRRAVQGHAKCMKTLALSGAFDRAVLLTFFPTHRRWFCVVIRELRFIMCTGVRCLPHKKCSIPARGVLFHRSSHYQQGAQLLLVHTRTPCTIYFASYLRSCEYSFCIMPTASRSESGCQTPVASLLATQQLRNACNVEMMCADVCDLRICVVRVIRNR